MRSEAWARGLGAGLGVVGGFILGYAMVKQGHISAPGSLVILSLTTLEGLIFSYLGSPYVLGGWRQVNFQLRTTPLPDLVAGLFGLIMGLLVAVLVGYFVRDFPPYGVPLSAVLAATYFGSCTAMSGCTGTCTRFCGGVRPPRRRVIASPCGTSGGAS